MSDFLIIPNNMQLSNSLFYNKKIQLQKYTIFIFGNKNIYYNANSNNGWLITGCGIINKNGFNTIMNFDDWDKYFLHNNDINGYFSGIKWNNNHIYIFSDPLTIRRVYYNENKTIFSSQLSLIQKQIKEDIDISSLKLLFSFHSTFSNHTEIKNIKRLLINEYIEINNNIKIKKHTMKFEKNNIYNVIDKASYINGNKKILFAISGGQDSRILLYYLLKNNKHNLDLITFGDNTNKDVIIVKYISKKFKLPLIHTKYNSRNIIKKIKDYYYFNSYLVGPERIPYLFNLPENDDYIYIDASHGEFLRKERFKKLHLFFYLYKYFLRHKHINSLINKSFYMNIPFLNIEIRKKIDTIKFDFIHIFQEYKKYYYNLDLGQFLSLKYYFPDFGVREQERIDNTLASYLIFNRKDLMFNKYNYKFPLSINHLYKNNPELFKIPYVKNNEYYIYYKKLKSHKEYNIEINKFLQLRDLREYLFDSIYSNNFSRNKYIDIDFMKLVLNEYYNKNNLQYSNILRKFIPFYFSSYID